MSSDDLLHAQHFVIYIILVDQSLECTLAGMMDNSVTVDGKEQRLADHPQVLLTMKKLTPVHFLQFATGATSTPAC